MKEQGIETTIGTIHIPMTSYYRQAYGFREGSFPVTDEVFPRSRTLPLHERLDPRDQERAVARLCDAVSSRTRLFRKIMT